MLKRIFILGAALFCSAAIAQERPIFDTHIHYSHDAVELVPPEKVAKIFRDAGVRKALVSSSDDNGTQLLLDAAPDIVVPALRPYRRRGEINTWMHDETVIDYLEENLAKNDYEAIGEFHAYGEDIKTPVIQRMIALAKERNLILHHHGDREAVDLIFETWPEARVLWAHSGFDDPASVSDALATYPRLWADLAFRSDMVSRGRLDPDWKAAFEVHPDRFMVGTDTFAPERWYYVGPHADFSREWLDLLPERIADNIAYANAERLLASE
ncbi:amidohydrolase family protein [Ruegeria arenilitoris]|uniref:amidohydrolase family protein n=1 Tax=Ruegeria arenilitoris TaxID=1173585 RepID=UPI0014809371